MRSKQALQRIRLPKTRVGADEQAPAEYTCAVSASEIIKELPKLSDAERRAVFDKLCELAQADRRWEKIIDDERPRPKLDAFIEEARAEGSEPLDLDKL
jgi:hypothetical protein